MAAVALSHHVWEIIHLQHREIIVTKPRSDRNNILHYRKTLQGQSVVGRMCDPRMGEAEEADATQTHLKQINKIRLVSIWLCPRVLS